jgi:3-oxoacyl-[acyl-carrier protein] reductase
VFLWFLRASRIIATAIEGAGVNSHSVSVELRDFFRSFRPMQSMGTLDDVASAAEYLAHDLSAFVKSRVERQSNLDMKNPY